MAKGDWSVTYRDKDSGEITQEKVVGPITGSQCNEELREQGHEPVGLRRSL